MTPDSDSAWGWDEAVWRSHVSMVRAGRRPPEWTWPDGCHVAVALSFDADQETVSLSTGAPRVAELAQGEYGSRVGSVRILRVLQKYDARATFFMPAVSAMLHPDEARAYVAGGHEIGAHGWIHEDITTLTESDEADLLRRSLDTLQDVTGVRPVGVRTPAWDFGPRTLPILRNEGLLYDSSLMGDDEPYELIATGVPTGIIEVPVEWIRDDATYLRMDRRTGVRPHMAPRQVLEIYRDEFDAARSEGGLFQLTMHPHISGHRSRVMILDALLSYIRSFNDVWFATHAEVAEYARGVLNVQ